jgi:hypothetical protein
LRFSLHSVAEQAKHPKCISMTFNTLNHEIVAASYGAKLKSAGIDEKKSDAYDDAQKHQSKQQKLSTTTTATCTPAPFWACLPWPSRWQQGAQDDCGALVKNEISSTKHTQDEQVLELGGRARD